MLTTKRCYWTAAFVVYYWIMAPEAVSAAIAKATCEQTYGYLGGRATLRCAYKPSNATISQIHWRKGQLGNAVYIYVPNNPSLSKPVGAFKKRNVTTKDGVAGVSGFHDMYIYDSILGDEDTYQCDLLPAGEFTRPVPCPRLTLTIPPSVFNLSYGNGSNFIPVPERDTDCTTGGITISTTGTTTLRYVTASRPRSNVTWNQVTGGSCVHTPSSDNTIQTTFQGDVTVKQGDTKLVKFTITSQNPNFTAEPLVKEACVKLHRAEGPSPPGKNIEH